MVPRVQIHAPVSPVVDTATVVLSIATIGFRQYWRLTLVPARLCRLRNRVRR